MRILITADPEIEVPPRLYGGIERIVDGLVRRLREGGHKVCLVAKPGSQCPADAFHSWPGASSLSRADTVRNGLALWKAVRTFKPDVIHSFSRIAYLAPLLRGAIPIVMSFQRDPSMRTVGTAVKLAAPGVLRFHRLQRLHCHCWAARRRGLARHPQLLRDRFAQLQPDCRGGRAALLPEPRREHQGR